MLCPAHGRFRTKVTGWAVNASGEIAHGPHTGNTDGTRIDCDTSVGGINLPDPLEPISDP